MSSDRMHNSGDRILLDGKNGYFWAVAVALFVIVLNQLSVVLSGVWLVVLPFVEMVAVLVSFLLGRRRTAFVLTVLFCSSSFEASKFVYGSEYEGGVYSFISMPYLGSYAFLAIVSIFLFLYVVSHREMKKWLDDHRAVRRAVRATLFVFATTVVATLISVAFNNNNATILPSFTSYLLTEFKQYYVVMCFMAGATYFLATHDDSARLFSELIKCLLCANVIAHASSMALGWHGFYGTSTSVTLLPLVSFFSILLSTLPLYKQSSKADLIFALFGVVDIAMSLIVSTPLEGKWFLLLAVLLLVAFANILRHLSHWKIILLSFAAFLISISFLFLPEIPKAGEHIQVKIEEALSIVQSLGSGNISQMADSPQYRIDEFENIAIEYLNQPGYFLAGKGFGGSTSHWTNTMSWARDACFSSEQYMNGIYVRVHETVNVLFLKSGLVGLLYFAILILLVLKRALKSPMVMLGGLWFLFFFGVYVSMAFGGIAMMVGLALCDSRNGEFRGGANCK